ncbi:MAG TPA: ABC transporter permease [Humisphaera sp.]|nr:ABC transporter permease [Humisphaera sp.]
MARPLPSGNKLARLFLPAWTIAVLVFLYLPIVLLVVYSFNNSQRSLDVSAAWHGFTLRWYRLMWLDEDLVQAVKNSLIIAAATMSASVALGTSAAWMLHRFRFPAPGGIQVLVLLPMIIPEIIMGVSLMLLFRAIGLQRGYLTVIIAHVTFCFPFVMAAVQARLVGLDPSLEEAAMDLGATPRQAFFRIIVPYLLPGIIAGAMLAFTLSLDEFMVTYFTYDAGSTTLPVRIYASVKAGMKPTLNAVSTLFVVATAILVLLSDAIGRRAKRS